MKPKFVALNLLLLLGIAGVTWQGKVRWDEAEARRRATFNVVVKPHPVPPAISLPRPETASAQKYNEVAQKNLFSKDRDPNVVIDPPKAPEPPKPMPKLPVVYGVMGLPSGVRALMAEKSGDAAAAVRTGDSVGEFKVLALDMKKVTFEWQDKQITKNIDDLVDRAGPQDRAAAAGPVGTAPAGAAPLAAGPALPRQAPAANTAPPANLASNPDVGGGGTGPAEKACGSDNSPAGTVVDGYKKVIVPTPFGPSCRWLK